MPKTGCHTFTETESPPEGDGYDLPPGRRQVSLASLLWLLAIASFVAALCQWLSFGVIEIILFELAALYLWWRIAEVRESVRKRINASQNALRQEVQRWLQQRKDG